MQLPNATWRGVLRAIVGLILWSGAIAENAPSVPVVTQIVLGTQSEACMVNPPTKSGETGLALALPLLAQLGSSAVTAGSQLLSDYLTDTIKNQTSSMELVSGSGFAYQMSKGVNNKWTAIPTLECISIVRGSMGAIVVPKLNATAAANDPRGYFKKVDAQGAASYPTLRSLRLSDYPELYLEFAVERDILNSAFRLRPTFIYLRHSKVKPATDGHVDLSITFRFSVVGSESPFAIIPLRVLGAHFAVVNIADSVSTESLWALMPPPPSAKILPQEVAHLLRALPVTPVNVQVSVEETGEPTRFLLFMSRVLGDAKPHVGALTEAAIQKALGPGK
jgi:hypothetical protein